MRRAWMLLMVCFAGARPAHAQSLVTGIVFDSVARQPLGRATVQLLQADERGLTHLLATETDVEGRYYFDAVRRGTYALGFLHPRLDSLQLETPLVPLAVGDSGTAVAMLGIPSARTLISGSCPKSEAVTGLLIGRARSAQTHLPAVGGAVRVEWQTFTYLNRALQQHTRGATVRTAEDGAFQLCGVPNGGLLRVRLMHGVEASGVVTLMVPNEGLLQRDLFASTEHDTSLAAAREALGGSDQGRGTIRGRTMRAEGVPVPGARVRFADGLAEAVSNSEGFFAMGGLPLGTATVDVRAVGFLPLILPVDVLPDGEGATNYIMQSRAEYLDTVKVIGKDVSDFNTGMAGFELRKRTAFGHYFGKAEIDSIAPQAFTDLLRRVSGMTLLPSRNGPRLVMHGMGLQMFCAPAVFLNGTRASELDGTGLDALVNVQDLIAVEAYTRTGSLPPQFQTLEGCGALAIWTRTRRNQ